MTTYDQLAPGDRVTWRAINRDPSGTVEMVTSRGVLVRVDGGGYVVLTTTESFNKRFPKK